MRVEIPSCPLERSLVQRKKAQPTATSLDPSEMHSGKFLLGFPCRIPVCLLLAAVGKQ